MPPHRGVGGSRAGFGTDAAFLRLGQCACSVISTVSTATASTTSAVVIASGMGIIWDKISLRVVGEPLGGGTTRASGTATLKAGTASLEHRRDRVVLRFSGVVPASRIGRLRAQVARVHTGGLVLDKEVWSPLTHRTHVQYPRTLFNGIWVLWPPDLSPSRAPLPAVELRDLRLIPPWALAPRSAAPHRLTIIRVPRTARIEPRRALAAAMWAKVTVRPSTVLLAQPH